MGGKKEEKWKFQLTAPREIGNLDYFKISTEEWLFDDYGAAVAAWRTARYHSQKAQDLAEGGDHLMDSYPSPQVLQASNYPTRFPWTFLSRDNTIVGLLTWVGESETQEK